MGVQTFELADFYAVAAGAAVLASGTGRGFSNASDDLALYYDAATGQSTGVPVSVSRVQTAAQLYQATGVLSSFAGLLRNIGYAGALPPGSL